MNRLTIARAIFASGLALSGAGCRGRGTPAPGGSGGSPAPPLAAPAGAAGGAGGGAGGRALGPADYDSVRIEAEWKRLQAPPAVGGADRALFDLAVSVA